MAKDKLQSIKEDHPQSKCELRTSFRCVIELDTFIDESGERLPYRDIYTVLTCDGESFVFSGSIVHEDIFEEWYRDYEQRLTQYIKDHLPEKLAEGARSIFEEAASTHLNPDANVAVRRATSNMLNREEASGRKKRLDLPKPGRPCDPPELTLTGADLDQAVPLAMEMISPQRLVTPDKVAEKLNLLYPHKKPFPSGYALKQKINRGCKSKWGDMKKRDIIRRNNVPVDLGQGMENHEGKD